jgi:sigma-B regulation protein RsbU (phosphoserine phosphatase)
LIYKGKVIGVLDLEHTRVNYYTEDHQTTLSTLAAQVAISIANARLYQRIHEEEQRLERDLAMAREVQLRLLPGSAPQPKRAEIATAFLPARLIGGDVYDFIDYSASKSAGRKRIAIMMGDVSGKAAPAALYAALVSGILRSLAARQLPPDELLAELNNQLQVRKLDSQYVTMLIAVWNDESRTLQVANAGSVQPIHVTFASSTEIRKKSNGVKTEFASEPDLQVTTIPAEGFPLGMFPDAEYDLLTVQTKPGDLIVFFSDGIVDAENADGEMFGTDRLRLVLRDHPEACQSAQATVDVILSAVDAFQAGTVHFDDETLVVLRVL